MRVDVFIDAFQYTKYFIFTKLKKEDRRAVVLRDGSGSFGWPSRLLLDVLQAHSDEFACPWKVEDDRFCLHGHEADGVFFDDFGHLFVARIVGHSADVLEFFIHLFLPFENFCLVLFRHVDEDNSEEGETRRCVSGIVEVDSKLLLSTFSFDPCPEAGRRKGKEGQDEGEGG